MWSLFLLDTYIWVIYGKACRTSRANTKTCARIIILDYVLRNKDLLHSRFSYGYNIWEGVLCDYLKEKKLHIDLYNFCNQLQF